MFYTGPFALKYRHSCSDGDEFIIAKKKSSMRYLFKLTRKKLTRMFKF